MITPRHTYILTWDLDNDMYPIHDRQKDMRRFHLLKRNFDCRYSLLSKNTPDFAGILYGSLNNHYLAKRGDRYFSLLFSRQEGYSTLGDSFYSSIEILFKQEFINEVNKGNIFVDEYKDDPIGMIAHQKLHNSKIIIGVRLKFLLYQYIVANQADININL